MPGDIVNAMLIKKKNNYAEARVVDVIIPSKERIKPKCNYFGVCGGCKQQSLNYETQLFYKQKQVVDTIQKLGGIKNFRVENIAGSDNIFFYRNKLEFSFSDRAWRTKEELLSDIPFDTDFALGFHIPKIYDKILDIHECWLQSDISNQILNFTRKFFLDKKVSAYSTKTHSGFLRNLVIKQSSKTKDLMVNLVTSEEDVDLTKSYTAELVNNFGQITTVVNNINKKLSQVAYGDYEIVTFGEGAIYDLIGDYKFRISANSFFQTNTLQAEKLYSCIVDFAEFNPMDIVYDLFSGAGTISLFVSGYVQKVFAFETVVSSIADAEVNTKLNSVNNVFHYSADLNKSILNLISEKSLPKPNIIITDPPRNGMHQNTIDDILLLEPEKIIYVSCNPATQARDIKLLCEKNYQLIKIKPFDMFPHTFHIENVALLKKL
ncbi:MAG: 23S rRNA (uracil(1939)-C(5))-methyltransferase RlmD [Ignavibacteriales bacterium]